jgi:hypothetical protein
VEGWDMMQEKDKNGKVHYHLNVMKHRLHCVACPAYEPAKKEEGKK